MVRKRKTKKRVLILLLTSALITAVILCVEKYSGYNQLTSVTRNSYGKGEIIKDLEVVVEGEEKAHSIQFKVSEQEYTESGVKKALAQATKDLDRLILAENASLDHVDSDLNLIHEIPNTGISVSWELDRYDLMDLSGQIKQDMLDEQGKLIELKAYLSYQDEGVLHVTHAVLYTPSIHPDEKIPEEIKEKIIELNNKTKESKEFLLPKTHNGKKLYWQIKSGQTGYAVFLLGIVAAVYIVFADKQKQQKKEKERRNQMLFDYPEIVSQLVLLIGAGMTVKRAWQTVVKNYEDNRKKKGSRFAYEEMCYTYREQQSKVMEIESYENFGKRCKVQEYIKFAALLSQNIKKGTSGLTSVLSLEASNAFSERKNRAKKLGEEASTKLLLPMFIMLSVVLVIIIIPAFLSIRF